MRLLQRLRRGRVDPSRPHPFRLANDGYRVTPGSLPAPGGDGSGVHMLTIRQQDQVSARCDVPGCGRRRNDAIHQLDD